jgi:hypothetical protein
MTLGVYLTYYYPHVMAVVFLAFLFSTDTPAKGRVFARALAALTIALLLAHTLRIFDLWPAHRYFASGHMTFCLGVAVSLGMLRPWTLAISLPLLIPFGMALVAYHFHSTVDVIGAVGIVLIVYPAVHSLWPIRTVSPHLDRAKISL